MHLLLKLNGKLKEIEKELDNLIQSKNIELATTPQTVIPIISTTVPSTLVATLAPIVPPATYFPVTGTSAGTGASTSAGTSTEKNN